MTKEQIIKKCKDAGLNVKIEDGVVKLIYDPEQKKEQIQRFTQKLEENEYKESWGYRGKNNSDKNAFSESEVN